MPEGAKERGVGLSGPLDCVSNVERIIFDKLNARRVTALAPSPAEVSFLCSDEKCGVQGNMGGGSRLAPVWFFLSTTLVNR